MTNLHLPWIAILDVTEVSATAGAYFPLTGTTTAFPYTETNAAVWVPANFSSVLANFGGSLPGSGASYFYYLWTNGNMNPSTANWGYSGISAGLTSSGMTYTTNIISGTNLWSVWKLVSTNSGGPFAQVGNLELY